MARAEERQALGELASLEPHDEILGDDDANMPPPLQYRGARIRQWVVVVLVAGGLFGSFVLGRAVSNGKPAPSAEQQQHEKELAQSAVIASAVVSALRLQPGLACSLKIFVYV